MPKKLVLTLFIFLSAFFLVPFAKAQTYDPSKDPNINLAFRGWQQTSNPPFGGNNLIDVSGPTDPGAPSLATLIAGNTSPGFTSLYQVYGWDFSNNQKTNPIAPDYSTNWGVTAAGLSTNPGDTIRVPASGYDIGAGNQVLVLYADANSITIAYTDSGQIVNGTGNGYAIQLENFSVDPAILTLYNQANAAGRTQLPALPALAVLGKASGKEILVAIRDSGSFMDPRSKKDWWQSRNGTTVTTPPQLMTINRSQSVPGTSSGAFRSFPEESEEACSPTDIASGTAGNPTYHKVDGSSEPTFKDSVGLNFDTSVRGTHCGQTKSQPLVLTETAPFNLFNDPKCKSVEWIGEVKVSDDNTNNFVLPFAKEIADHWSGKGAEHFNEDQNLIQQFINSASQLLSGQKGTLEPKNSSVLTRLLGRGYQDQLKCSFINYVKKKGTSSYKNFTIDPINIPGFQIGGSKLTDIPCPPSVLGNNDSAANDAWDKSWRNIWSRIGLFPDEKSHGQIRFAVCSDKLYNLDTGYPSVFRLGLATNELFKLFTAKDYQDSYYKANGDTSGFAKPLDQNKSLVKKPAGGFLSFVNDFFGKLKSFVSTVLAQGTGTITVTPRAEVVNGQLVYSIDITLPSGVDGHVNVEIVGTGKGTVNYVPVGRTISLGTPGSGATAIIDGWPLLRPGDTVEFQVKCDDCKSSDQGQPIRVSCTSTISGQTNCKPLGAAVPPPPACGPNQCCETRTCSSSCAICNLAQKNPSDTTVWPQGYSYNRINVGNPSVDFTFKIPDWNYGDPLPAGCRLVNVCAPTNTKCIANAEYCEPGGRCGDIRCEKIQDRTISVYNKVPFLASIWKEGAATGTGFLNIFKSKALTGFGLRSSITGCAADTNLVLDPSGNFGTNPAYSEVTYSFQQKSGEPDVRVEQSSPGKDQKAKLTFYRLGGLCNADTWVSQKLLLP